MRYCYLFVLLLTLSACASAPAYETLPNPEGQERATFRVAPSNSYGILVKGRVFECHPRQEDAFIPFDKLSEIATVVSDYFVDNDLAQLGYLLRNKRFDTYEVTADKLGLLLARISQVSNSETRVFFAYSGEGTKVGLLTQTYQPGNLNPDGTVIEPEWLFDRLALIQGSKALLLNACESGIFAQWPVTHDTKFQGVVIASCAEGYATTPCESTGTSAIYAAFFRLYEEPESIRNLAHAGLTCNYAGTPWSNLRHRWVNFWSIGGLPISYDAVVFSNAEFML